MNLKPGGELIQTRRIIGECANIKASGESVQTKVDFVHPWKR
jgi:hypothetical protein